MTLVLNFEDFFSSEQLKHRDLWREGQPIWSPLIHLKDYLKTIKQSIEIKIPERTFLENSDLISIGAGTVIEPGVMIQGPCVIGKNCTICHGAYLRGPVLLGDGCHVGHSSEIKNSVLLNFAAATHFVYLGDSILGHHVNLGAGVKCANLRLDRREVSVFVDGKRWRTGLRKLGAILGDWVQIGCNSVLNPGTLVERHCFAYPMMNLSGWIPSLSQITKQGVQPIRKKVLESLLCKK